MIPIFQLHHVHFHSREIPMRYRKQVDFYTVFQKTRHFIATIISSCLNRFSKFFHCWKVCWLCYKTLHIITHAPHLFGRTYRGRITIVRCLLIQVMSQNFTTWKKTLDNLVSRRSAIPSLNLDQRKIRHIEKIKALCTLQTKEVSDWNSHLPQILLTTPRSLICG